MLEIMQMNKSEKSMQEMELSQRLKWFINLRWFAVAGVFLVIMGTRYVFGLKIPVYALFLGNAALLAYNVIFLVYYNSLKEQESSGAWFSRANHFANIQISIDLVMLTYLIVFSGGLRNPFIFYFIFHMIIASILLSNRAAYLQATLAAGLVIIIGVMEYIAPVYVSSPGLLTVSGSNHYLSGVLFAFTTTLYLAVYMATSIVNKLRNREQELAVANERLKEEDRLKSQYVLTVSHDLQESLSAIQSCLKVVLVDLTGDVPGKAREMIARAEGRSRYLLGFVKDLLDLSRIRATRELEKNTVSLSDITKKVVDQLSPKANEKKISIILDLPQTNLTVHANSDSLEHLLINLVTNAIKYTPWGGNIGIGLKEEKKNIQVSVWDTGIGIPREDLPHIFEDFYRAKNACAIEKDGTGLGLAIVKQIIEAHSGQIWVESQVGKKSQFTFILPKFSERGV